MKMKTFERPGLFVFFCALTALLLTTTAIPTAFASSATDLVEQATSAYNKGNYEQAQHAFILAIQATPQDANLYRSLARTYFWQNNYTAATAYYDFYLRLAASNATDVEQIQGERRLSATRSGNQVWQLTDQQRLILESLEDQLDDGRAYTTGGGGAWSLYQTLIRTQFAQPELIALKKRLVRRLFDEIEGRFVAPSDQPTPQLELDDWKTQRERIEATRSLTNDEVILDALARRIQIVNAVDSLLLARFSEAAKQAQTAMSDNPDLVFPAWYYIVALIHSEQYDRALAALDTLEARIEQTVPAQANYVQILRAAVLDKSRQHDAAASIYSGILAP